MRTADRVRSLNGPDRRVTMQHRPTCVEASAYLSDVLRPRQSLGSQGGLPDHGPRPAGWRRARAGRAAGEATRYERHGVHGSPTRVAVEPGTRAGRGPRVPGPRPGKTPGGWDGSHRLPVRPLG